MDTSSIRAGGSEERSSRRGKRRFRSVELKRQIVEETLDGGTSVAVIARRHGVNANQVFSWRRQYHRGELATAAQCVRSPALLPVTVGEQAVGSDSGTQGDDASVSGVRLEIEFSGGRRVRVWGRVDSEALRTVIRELSQR